MQFTFFYYTELFYNIFVDMTHMQKNIFTGQNYLLQKYIIFQYKEISPIY